MSEDNKKTIHLPIEVNMEEVGELTEKAKKKATSMWGAFKKFAFKGNVMDMAVGVVVGTAFTKIVNSVVADVITPFISLITGGVDFTNLKWVIREAVMEGDTVVKDALTINYGNLFQAILDFFIIALTVFLVVKLLTVKRDKAAALAAAKAAEEAKRKAEEDAKKPKEPTETELLKDILEELRKR